MKYTYSPAEWAKLWRSPNMSNNVTLATVECVTWVWRSIISLIYVFCLRKIKCNKHRWDDYGMYRASVILYSNNSGGKFCFLWRQIGWHFVIPINQWTLRHHSHTLCNRSASLLITDKCVAVGGRGQSATRLTFQGFTNRSQASMYHTRASVF